MTVSRADLDRRIRPPAGWPSWAIAAPYVGAAHPQATHPIPLDDGANCQRYAYAVLELFGRTVPPHRSSELWDDEHLTKVSRVDARALDLALFNGTSAAWGAHVAVVLNPDELLHLCREVGHPVIWSWDDFATREQYSHIVGLIRANA